MAKVLRNQFIVHHGSGHTLNAKPKVRSGDDIEHDPMNAECECAACAIRAMVGEMVGAEVRKHFEAFTATFADAASLDVNHGFVANSDDPDDAPLVANAAGGVLDARSNANDPRAIRHAQLMTMAADEDAPLGPTRGVLFVPRAESRDRSLERVSTNRRDENELDDEPLAARNVR
jgi:hypothetical protein